MSLPHLLLFRVFHDISSFQKVVIPHQYNMSYWRQKPLCQFFIIFLQNTKQNNIVVYYSIFDKIKTALDEI
jgi:hypothetical protein